MRIEFGVRQRSVWMTALLAVSLSYFAARAKAQDAWAQAMGSTPSGQAGVSTNYMPPPGYSPSGQAGVSGNFAPPPGYNSGGSAGISSQYQGAGMGGANAPGTAPGSTAGAGTADTGNAANAPGTADTGGGSTGTGAGEASGGGSAGGSPAVIGDQSPFFPQPFPPPNFRSTGNGVGNNIVRLAGFKISENQFPRPQDRVYFNFNYFNNVNKSLNHRFGIPLVDVGVYHYLFGIEKTIGPNNAIGVRLPLNNIQFGSTTPGLGGSSTSIQDLDVYFKHVIFEDDDTGNLISLGMAVNIPTGPARFAGSPLFPFNQATTLQPFTGYIFNFGSLFLQGFTGVDVPLSNNGLSVLLYNDLALGYYLYQAEAENEFLSAIIPTFEAHVNTPLSHRGFRRDDFTNNTDVVNLVLGSHFILFDRVILTGGFAVPVTGPKPFDFEAIGQLNVLFGGPRNRARQQFGMAGPPPTM